MTAAPAAGSDQRPGTERRFAEAAFYRERGDEYPIVVRLPGTRARRDRGADGREQTSGSGPNVASREPAPGCCVSPCTAAGDPGKGRVRRGERRLESEPRERLT